MTSSKEVTPDDTMCIVSGWGHTSDGGTISQVLMAVTIPIVTTATCLQVYGGRDVVTERMICAGLKEGGMILFYNLIFK